jgi:hypothetical protein
MSTVKPAKSAVQRKSVYSPHPSIAYALAVIANMQGKTGRSLEEWVAFIEKTGPAGEAGRREWLKKEHALGSNYAGYLAAASVGKSDDFSDAEKYLEVAEKYVADMYAGPKAALRPMYDRLLEVGFGLAKDVKVCPCRTMVPFFREHVIAQVKPATKARIDFGLALGKHKGRLPKRLIDTGGAAKQDRITHKLELTALDQIDAELVKWLRVAYDLDAGG